MRHVGTAYLTNHRMVFEAQMGGGLFEAARIVTIVNTPMERIVDAAVSFPRFGPPVLHVQTTTGNGVFNLSNPGRWQHEIAAMKAVAPRPGPGPAPAPPPVMQHTIEREVVKVRCRHCGTLNLETDRMCASCRAPL